MRLADRAPIPLRFALRNLRAGLSGFLVLFLCVALGVAAIVAVGATARGLIDGVAASGRRLIGGDVVFSFAQREASAAELAFLETRGRVVTVATLRSMARAGEASVMVDMKAVGPNWPDGAGAAPDRPESDLPASDLGAPVLDPPMRLSDALAGRAQADGSTLYGVAAAPELFARLDLKPGEAVNIGGKDYLLTTRLVSQPDALGVGLSFGLPVLASLDALRASGLLQPGALTRWSYRVILPAGAPAGAGRALARDFRAAFPDAAPHVAQKDRAAPQLERNLQRFADFLTLVGLTALVVGGVGAANAAAAFVQRKRADVATLKALGASGGRVVAIMLTQAMLIAAAAALTGAALGTLAPFLVQRFAGDLLSARLAPGPYPGEIALGLAYGLVVTFTFSIAALGRAHDAPVAALFRDGEQAGARAARLRYRLMAGAGGLGLIALAAAFSGGARLALAYAGATGAAFLALRGVAFAVMAGARRLRPPRSTPARLALSNIWRPGALTPSVVLSLGLGLTLLVALALVQANVAGQFARAVAGRTPSFFFLDVPAAQADAFAALIAKTAPEAKIERVPMLRGRIVSAHGVAADRLKPSEDAEWALRGDRGITFARDIPEGSKVVEGRWWAPDYSGPPLVSMEAGVARGLGIKVGDEVVVNVLGRRVSAQVASLREVDWRSFGINFVLVYSPHVFDGAPFATLATASFPKDAGPAPELALAKAVGKAFPAVVSVQVRAALDAARAMVDALARGVKAAAAIAVLASIFVLAGALSAGRETRVYEAAILKTLGASRAQLALAYLIEYAGLGAATAAFAIAAGTATAYAASAFALKLPFVFDAGAAGLALALALGLTVALGFAGAWRAFGAAPARRLRAM